MGLQLHNLLVSEQKRKVRVLYYTRVCTVAAALCGIAVVLGVGALVPSYVLLTSELETVQEEIQSRKDGAEGRTAVEEEVAKARALLTTLAPYADCSCLTSHLVHVFEVLPERAKITGFSYEHDAGLIVLEGVAATRADLVAYTNMLEQSEHVARVVLPIAHLARSTDVRFSLNITLREPADHENML